MKGQRNRIDAGGTGAGVRKGAAARRGTGMVWVLLAIVTTAALAVGACAIWLPDRAPAVLGRAGEVTAAPVGTQRYDGAHSVTVIPQLAPAYELTVNTGGTVTENHAAQGLESGRTALKVDGRAVIALNTATPLYRDIAAGGKGDDVRALNAELARLGLGADPESSTASAATVAAIRQLLRNNGLNADDGTLHVTDVMWIPSAQVSSNAWTAGVSTRVTPGMKVGEVPGGVTAIDIKNDTGSDRDRTLTVMGETVTLPAGQSGTTDADFCRRVSQSDEFRTKSRGGGDLAAGFGASVALAAPVEVLRVPAGAVFGVQGSRACVAVDGRSVPVSVVGADLGVSLVSMDDGSTPSTVELGSRIAGLACS